jgi:hypothetical protein
MIAIFFVESLFELFTASSTILVVFPAPADAI